MARKSRERDEYGVYHISQKSSGTIELFSDDREREHFLEIVAQARDRNNFRLLSYCVTDPDVYHLILDANGCDISKVMKEINIRYSIFKDSPGELFKDRFRSRLLTSGFKAAKAGFEPFKIGEPGQYSSCRDFRETIRALTPAKDTVTSLDGQEEVFFRPGCHERIKTAKEAEKWLKQQSRKEGSTAEELLGSKPLRNELIRDLKACSTLTMKEIGRIFNLSESSVSKILNAAR